MMFIPGKNIRIYIVCIQLLFLMSAVAQQPGTSISFDFKNEPLKTVLNFIIDEYRIPVVYQDDQIKNIVITASCDNCDIETSLDRILYNLPLIWRKIGTQYIITKKSGKNIIHGFVRDEANGETMNYASVYLEGTTFGDMSNEYGYYVIDGVPDGEYQVKALMIGYVITEKTANLSNSQSLAINFNMKEDIYQTETIVVSAEKERFEHQVEPSKIQISRMEIQAAPALLEADLFRTIQTLPGVVAHSDFSSALYIRGGNPSENMILLDDVRIYNPYHLGGVFSTFNTDAIKNVDISLGGFPARYGNATSSVISIMNKDGNSKEFEGSGSVSLLSSKLELEGPIPNGSYIISGRRTYFDFLYNTFSSTSVNNNIPYYFYDFHGKLNYSFSPNSRLSLSGFYGDDVLDTVNDNEVWDNQTQSYRTVGQDKTDIRFGNFSTTLKWQYIFNPRLFSKFILAKSRFRVSMLGDYADDESAEAKDVIEDLTIRGDITYFHSDNHEIIFGFDLQRLDFKIAMDISDISLIDYSRKANFYSAYLQDDWKLSSRLNVQSGLRITHYELGDFVRLDPRISARYRLKHNVNLKASYGLYHQYFYTFNPEDIDFLNYIRLIDLWFPIDERYKPIQAVHYIGGLEYLVDDDYLFSVEAYFKDYDHLLDLNELGDEGENDDFLRGHGKSTGLELMLRKQTGDFSGWLSYTLGYTERTIELPRSSYFQGNNNVKKEFQTYNPSFDRRHSLTFVGNYQQNEKWRFGTRFTFASGLPETPTIGWTNTYSLGNYPNQVTGELAPVKAAKNSQRYPDYLRLDVSIMRTYQYKSWVLQPYLQIINLTNHKNIFIYSYDLARRLDSGGRPLPAKRRGIPMFPIVPTFGVNFKF